VLASGEAIIDDDERHLPDWLVGFDPINPPRKNPA